MLTERRRKEIASLAQRKHRRRLGQTVVEGVRAVSGALAAGAPLVEIVVTHEAAADPGVAALFTGVSAPVHRVDNRTMERLTGVESPQGILAVAETRMSDPSALRTQRRILALDGVQDPGNVGTLIRTAAWFGIGGILLGPGTADVFAPKVVRATMSALWEVSLSEADDLAAALGSLRRAQFTAYAAALSGLAASDWEPAVPSVLVLGSEAHGLSPSVRAEIDASVTIPGGGRQNATDSLNVATAGAVLMYQWTR